jgi:hypothetical protein
VTAAVWALVALLAASLGILATALFSAIARTDGLRAELGARIDNLGSDLREEIRGLRGDISALDARLTRAGG